MKIIQSLPPIKNWNLIALIEVLIAIVVGIVTFSLVSPASRTVMNFWQILLVVLFFVLVGYNLRQQKLKPAALLSKLTTIGIFTLAMFVGFFSGQPASKTLTAAAEDTQMQRTAIQTGLNLGEKVQQQQLTTAQAEQQISQQYSDPDTQKLAQQSLTQKTTTTKPDTQILTETLPTIPVRLNQWTCVAIGCSYADDTYVWTLSTTNRLASSLITAISLIAITLVINLKYPKLKVD